MKKKIWILIALMTMLCGCNGYTMGNFDYKFNYAYIGMPDGSNILCKIETWTQVTDGTIIIWSTDGTKYLVSPVNCVLVEESSTQ